MARAAVANDVIVGLILAIDNVPLFVLVPWMGALSDRRTAAGRNRRLLVISGLTVAACGMAMLRVAPAYGLAGLLAATVVLNTGQFGRSPGLLGQFPASRTPVYSVRPAR